MHCSDSEIPTGSATVNVSIIDNGTRLHLPSSHLVNPGIQEHPYLTIPSLSFLIEHPATQRRLLFDLALRPDFTALPPAVQDFLSSAGWKVSVDKDVTEILNENQVCLDNIEAVIFSHHHFDHVGDLSRFPPSTKIIVGPGFQSTYLPGWPQNPESSLLQEDWVNRPVDELSFASDTDIATVSGFKAIDYFRDGSFYLLNAPGHTVGHIAALARTSAAPDGDTFVLMAGDICYYSGIFRSSDVGSCSKPCYRMPVECMVDVRAAEDSIRKLGVLDARDDILVILAHDEEIIGQVDLYPGTINAWKSKGIANRFGEEL